MVGTPKQQRMRLFQLAALFVGFVWLCLAFRRWGCLPWWSDRCLAGFGQVTESAFLFRWVTDPETLITGGLALGAAVGGAYLLNQQIQQTERLDAERQAARFRAVRAATPLVLSELSEWAEQQAEGWLFAVDRLTERRRGDERPPGSPTLSDVSFPTLHPSIVGSLKDMIETSSAKEAEPYIVMLSELQVQKARSRSLIEQARLGGRGGHTLAYCELQVLEAAEIYARASALFDHARDEAAEKRNQVTPRNVKSALFSMGIRDGSHPSIYAQIPHLFGEEDAPNPDPV